MSNVTKLTNTNYLMWAKQIHALLDGYALAGHLDGSIQTPAPTVTTADVTSLNPAYVRHTRQDKLIYSALLGAMTTAVQPLVSRTTTASEIWEKLAATYAKPSRAHIKQLRDQLKASTKGSKTIDDYIQGVTTKLDQIALLGKPFDHEDQVELILAGLPDDYKTVIDQIEGKDNPPSITEVHERLLNHESKLLAMAAPSFVIPFSANTVQQRQSTNNFRDNRSNNRRYNNNQTQQNSFNNNSSYQQQTYARPDSRSFRPYLGKCQICNTQGHSARRCPQFQSMTTRSPPQSNPFRPWQPRANLAVASPYSAANWLLDSGATHHITSDLQNLSMHQPYTGNDDVLIADGSSLRISHTGEVSHNGGPLTPRQD